MQAATERMDTSRHEDPTCSDSLGVQTLTNQTDDLRIDATTPADLYTDIVLEPAAVPAIA